MSADLEARVTLLEKTLAQELAVLRRVLGEFGRDLPTYPLPVAPMPRGITLNEPIP